MASRGRTTTDAPESLFWSLPEDIHLIILAHVPRRYYPILSCVSKKLRSLVRSSELHKTRSLLKTDYFYVCFAEYACTGKLLYHWYTLSKNRRLVPIPFPSSPLPCSAALMVGSDIYFVGSYPPSRSMWILDSRSGKFREGPSSLVTTSSPSVGLVGDKIYVFGGKCEEGYEDIQAQVFNIKTQSWYVAPNPSTIVHGLPFCEVPLSLDRKIYARGQHGKIMTYDTRDGNVEILADQQIFRYSLCVVDNVFYMHDPRVGLMWYDSKAKEWREVRGVKVRGYFYNLAMADYNGKLAFLWRKLNEGEIWCAMITLNVSKLGIQGRVEWCNCVLSNVNPLYNVKHLFSRTD